jgi:hypothetical protein
VSLKSVEHAINNKALSFIHRIRINPVPQFRLKENRGQWLYCNLENRSLLLLAGALGLAALQALLFQASGALHKPPFELHGIDINLLQKMLFCFFSQFS